MKYEMILKYLKTLTEPTRLNIVEILSCGELCACDILEGLSITQTTLSHHMKILTKSELISKRKEATFVYYSINREKYQDFLLLMTDLIEKKDDDCLCSQKKDKVNITKEKKCFKV